MRKVTKILSHITCTYDTLFSYLFVVLQRDQINLATSFVDASFLYGSSDTKANIVRETNSCKLFFMTYHWVCSKSNTTGASREAGTACHSGAPVFVGFALLDLLGFLSKGLFIVVREQERIGY
jgi:hypothetical protein